jgi:hypothetical protein
MCEPNAIERDDGTLVMLARTGKGYLYRCDSTDGGETWSEERPTTLRSPLAPFHMSKDPYTGWVFIAWHNSFPGPVVQCPRSPLSLAVSRDGCDSWEFICDIENDPMSSYGYPAFHFTRDSVIVAYYETLGHRKFVKEEQHAKVAVFKRSELTVDRVVKEPLTPSAATVRCAPHLRDASPIPPATSGCIRVSRRRSRSCGAPISPICRAAGTRLTAPTAGRRFQRRG